jgi:ubiquinone/menaquinone biosynthesis C-methylase UbiE
LEHCNDRNKTLDAMIKVLKNGGYIYLSFPSEKSVNFPARNGCLNYYDDSTHKDVPPNFSNVIETLKENNMKIIFSSRSYKPFGMFLIGALNEWKSKRDKDVKTGTWAYWGFETIIWAKK